MGSTDDAAEPNGLSKQMQNSGGRAGNEIATNDTTRMERDRDAMGRLFWNEGGASENQHSVAVAVEPVPPLHGISIDGEDLLAARKRRHQDQ